MIDPASGLDEVRDDEGDDAVWERRCTTLFRAWVQVRYHRRRQRFFDLWDKSTKAITVVLGASLLGQFVNVKFPWLAAAITSLGLLALVFGYGDRKQQHKELAERAAELVGAIEQVPVGELTPANTAIWNAEYARLCAKAPPPLKALTLLCEWEQAAAEGHPNYLCRPGFLRRLLADYVS